MPVGWGGGRFVASEPVGVDGSTFGSTLGTTLGGVTLGGVAGSPALIAFASEAAPAPAVSEFAAAGADYTLCFLKYSSNTPRNRLASPSSLAAAIVATLMSYSFP